MRRALSKPHLRIAAVDDGAFSRTDRNAPLIALVWSGPDLLEAIAIGRVRVDGTDGTDRVVALVRSLPQYESVRAVLLDGIVVGGFNVLDLDVLATSLRRPVIAVTRDPPRFAAIRAALRKYFPRDHAVRYERLRRHPLFRVEPGTLSLHAACVGCSRRDATALLLRTVRRGRWPEPLRIAHMVGHAVGIAGPVRPRLGPRRRAVRKNP